MNALRVVVVVAAAACVTNAACEKGPSETTASRAHPGIAGYAAYDPNAKGEEQIAAATAKAKTEHKRVLAIFGGNWCKWCRALDATMNDDAATKALVDKSFVVVHVDSDTNGGLNGRYGNPFVNGFPVMLVLDAEGNLLHTQEGGVLEKDDKSDAYDADKVITFLRAWTPA